ncbi:MAG: SRPBCC family protein [Verrucomicrobiota bacterium]
MNDADQVSLQQGEILVWEEERPVGEEKRFILAMAVIDHPLQEVWDLIDDKEAIPLVIESVIKAEVVSRKGNTTVISQEVKGLGITRSAHYVVKHVGIFPHRVEFERVSGDFEHIEGQWLFETLTGEDGAQKTVLTYRLHLDAGKYVPQGLIIKSQLKKLPPIMTAIRARLASAQ